LAKAVLFIIGFHCFQAIGAKTVGEIFVHILPFFFSEYYSLALAAKDATNAAFEAFIATGTGYGFVTRHMRNLRIITYSPLQKDYLLCTMLLHHC
jgi:hypothetical protein